MQLIVQNYTNKYYYTKHYAARNNVVPIFRGGITQTEDRLFKMLPKIEKMDNGKILINGLALAGLAWVLGKLDVIKDSDFLKLVSSKINNMTDSNRVETIPPYSEENSIDATSKETEDKEEKTSKNSKIQEKQSISEDELERRYKNYFIIYPERKAYLDYINDYEDLLDNYKNLIKKSLLNNCDKQTKENLKGFEDILRRLPGLTEGYYNAPEEISNKRLNPSQFLQNLNTIYLDKFDDICKVYAKEKNLFRQNRGGNTLNTMHRIAKGEFQPEFIEEYLSYPNITFYEFASIKQFRMERFLSYLNDMKEKYNIMQYRFAESKYERDIPNFAIQFNPGLSTQKYIEATINMFEKLHGEIKLHSDKVDGKNYDYTMENLYDELFVRMRKDSFLTPLYNFAKFINPEIMSEFNYSDDEVNSIPYGSAEYIALKRKIAGAIAYLDNNARVREVIEVMNDNNIFHNYIDNIHSILRFICRFVINDNYNPKINFREECIKQTKNLKDALAITMRNSALIQTYKHYTGLAPCFYLAKENPLGEDILVTLNKHGQIHTIYETIDKPESYIRTNKAKQTEENELK